MRPTRPAADADAAVRGPPGGPSTPTDWGRGPGAARAALPCDSSRPRLDADFEILREITIAEAGAPRMWTDGPQLRIPVDGPRLPGSSCSRPTNGPAISAWPRRLGLPTARRVHREPAGVVAAITPWNFPNQINLAKLGPALAAGCTVVLKTGPRTPRGPARKLGRIVATQTDIPPGVVNVLTLRAGPGGPESS